MAVKIKPEYSINLNTLLKEQNLTGKQLAEMIPTSEQTISKARTGVRLTLDIAKRIQELYPEYNLLWILGRSDAKRNADVKAFFETVRRFEEREAMTRKEDFFSSIVNIAIYCGFGAEYDGTTLVIEDRPTVSLDDSVEGIDLNVETDCKELIEDVVAFMKYRLQKAIERGR